MRNFYPNYRPFVKFFFLFSWLLLDSNPIVASPTIENKLTYKYLTIKNSGSCAVNIWYRKSTGYSHYTTLNAGASCNITTYQGHSWCATNTNTNWSSLKYNQTCTVGYNTYQTWNITPAYCVSNSSFNATFTNTGCNTVDYYLYYNGYYTHYGSIGAGQSKTQSTYSGKTWVFKVKGSIISKYTASSYEKHFSINSGGSVSASISGNTVVCNGGTTTLTANGGSHYKWSNGSTSQSITVGEGHYTVTVSQNGCSASKSVKVTSNSVDASIAGETEVCNGNTTTLTASEGSSYKWSTGSSSQSIDVGAGTYHVTVYSNGCSAKSSITVNSTSSNLRFSNCPSNITLTTSNGCASASWDEPNAEADCGDPSVSSNYSSGYCFPVGTTTVVYTAKLNGSTRTCSFTVTVNKKSSCSTSFNSDICYKIANRGNGKVLDVNGGACKENIKVETHSYNGDPEQQWRIKSLGDGYVKLEARNCGMVIGTHSKSSGSSVEQFDYFAGGAKDWKISCNDDGSYTIKHRLSGLTLDADCSHDGCPVQIRTHDGSSSQKWDIVEVSCNDNGHNLLAANKVSLNVKEELNKARIEWISSGGFNNDYFVIQRLDNNTGKFLDHKTINAASKKELEYYVDYDNDPQEGDNWYQVKVVYNNGDAKVTEPVVATFNKQNVAKIFPNPATDQINVDLKSYEGKPVTLYLYDNFGRTVLTRQIQAAQALPVTIDLESQMMGQYVLRIVSQGKKDKIQPVVIIK
jgi:hypothetical protein